MTNPVDLFAPREKTPSVSFKGAAPGTTKVLVVTDAPVEQQSRNYDTGKPEFWEDGQPKKIILVKVTENGEARALWVTRGTALFKAVSDAQSAAGALIAPGGVITLTFTHETPPSNPRHNNVKQYAATYNGANAFTPATTPAVSTPVEAAANPPAAAPDVTEAALAALKAAGVDVSAFAK